MEIVEAVWEKRNLDKKVVEIDMQSEDFSDFLFQVEDLEFNYEYIVVKIPAGNLNLLFDLQTMGYFFAEALIRCRINVNEFELTPLYQRIMKVTSVRLATPVEQEFIVE